MHIVIHRLVYVRLLDVTSWHRPSICELIYVTRLVASIYLMSTIIIYPASSCRQKHHKVCICRSHRHHDGLPT